MAFQSSRQMLLSFRATAAASPVLSTFALIGSLWSSYTLYQFWSFIHLHFLHRNGLHQFKVNSQEKVGSSAPFALITGATDGLGKAYAEELASQGFNLVLHGRNIAKLIKVQNAIQARLPTCIVKTITLDASIATAAEIHAALDLLQHLPIRILVNNIGGAPTNSGPMCVPHATRDPTHDHQTLNINLNFTLEVTRAILPNLTQDPTAPSLVLNVGSGAARLPCPYIALAAATKAFLEAFSRSLQAELRAEGHTHVEVQYQLVGLCSTGSEPRRVSLLVPSARTFARSSLRKAGSGWVSSWGYWPHAVQFETIFKLPGSLVERICIGIVKGQIMQEDDEREKARKVAAVADD